MGQKGKSDSKARKGAPSQKHNPGRERYWREGRLEKRRVKNLVRCCGMRPAQARELWRRTRKHVKRFGESGKLPMAA